jgi:transcriptional regulator with XRE-family HTH domain
MPSTKSRNRRSGAAKRNAVKAKTKARGGPRGTAAPSKKLARNEVDIAERRGSAVQEADRNTLRRVGTRLHHARQLREMRMKDVALSAGCSESMISKIENNKAVPSLGVLHRICEALNLTLGELLSAQDDKGNIVARAGERRVVDIDPLRKGTGIRLERLVPYAKGHLIQGNIHIIAPGGSSDGTISHVGEEVGYVLSGEIDLTVGEQTYRLQAGDSFCYNSELHHGYRNCGKVEARVLFVNTPPSF